MTAFWWAALPARCSRQPATATSSAARRALALLVDELQARRTWEPAGQLDKSRALRSRSAYHEGSVCLSATPGDELPGRAGDFGRAGGPRWTPKTAIWVG